MLCSGQIIKQRQLKKRKEYNCNRPLKMFSLNNILLSIIGETKKKKYLLVCLTQISHICPLISMNQCGIRWFVFYFWHNLTFVVVMMCVYVLFSSNSHSRICLLRQGKSVYYKFRLCKHTGVDFSRKNCALHFISKSDVSCNPIWWEYVYTCCKAKEMFWAVKHPLL